MSVSEVYARWRYRLIPDHVLGEILSKNWIDNAIPAVILLISLAVFAALIPDFFSVYGLTDNGRQLGELMFVVLGMTLVMLAGGIDLSVGSNFALATSWRSAAQRARLAGPARGRRRDAGRRRGRPGQRHAGRLSAPARLPDDARHADHRRAIVDTLILKYSGRDRHADFSRSDVWDFMRRRLRGRRAVQRRRGH